MPDDLLQPKQFTTNPSRRTAFKENMRQSNEYGRHRQLLKETYALEHQALEPRTVEAWGHTGGKCAWCHPSMGLGPKPTDVI